MPIVTPPQRQFSQPQEAVAALRSRGQVRCRFTHQSQATAVVGLGLHEVEAPDVVAVPRPQANAAAIFEPEPGSLGLLLRHFQPLTAPDALDPILAHLNAIFVQQGRDTAVAIPAILGGEVDNVAGQIILVGLKRGKVSLRSPRLPDDPASQTFAQPVLLPSRIDRLPAPFGAYKFPDAMSLRTCFSSDRSATSFFNRLFSFSNCLSRLA